MHVSTKKRADPAPGPFHRKGPRWAGAGRRAGFVSQCAVILRASDPAGEATGIGDDNRTRRPS